MSSISVCIIAKDERENIERAVASVVDGVDEVLVVDTGSKDDTAAIAERAGARVISYEWQDDFSAARNFALDNVSSEWVLQLDADEALSGPASRLQVLAQYPQIDAFHFQVVSLVAPDSLAGSSASRAHRFFRRGDWRNEGIIHELPAFKLERSPKMAWSGLQILHWGYIPGPLLPAKNARNHDLLEKAIRREPKNSSLHYFLGSQYIQSGEWEPALEALLEADRLSMGGDVHLRALLALRICTCLLETGALKAARKRVTREATTFYDYRELLFLAGRIYEASCDWASAAKYYRRCAETPGAPEKYLITQDGLERIATERAHQCRDRSRQ